MIDWIAFSFIVVIGHLFEVMMFAVLLAFGVKRPLKWKMVLIIALPTFPTLYVVWLTIIEVIQVLKEKEDGGN